VDHDLAAESSDLNATRLSQASLSGFAWRLIRDLSYNSTNSRLLIPPGITDCPEGLRATRRLAGDMPGSDSKTLKEL